MPHEGDIHFLSSLAILIKNSMTFLLFRQCPINKSLFLPSVLLRRLSVELRVSADRWRPRRNDELKGMPSVGLKRRFSKPIKKL